MKYNDMLKEAFAKMSKAGKESSKAALKFAQSLDSPEWRYRLKKLEYALMDSGLTLQDMERDRMMRAIRYQSNRGRKLRQKIIHHETT